MQAGIAKREVVTAPDQSDKRQAPRKRTLLSGKIVYQEGAISFDCTIVDFSATGARVRISRGQPLPSTLYLLDIRNAEAYEANVAWAKPPLWGLKFVHSYPLKTAVQPNLKFLRTLWIACAAR